MSDDNLPDARTRSTLAANLFAALLLAMSVTMLTDFTRRLLSADPDSLGIAAIAVQAVFAIAASSTFTSFGWSLLPRRLAGFQASDSGKAKLRFALSGGLFLLMALVWYLAPPWLAQFYNTRGFYRPATQASLAAREYRRAIALDPTQQFAYYNLGENLETAYQYSDAAAQYQKAITANPTDPNPYNNLARVLLLDGKSLTALQITDDALALPNLPAASRTTLLKNRAQAELELGFYSPAIADATQSGSAAAQCVLAKTYARLNQPTDAKKAWTTFEQILKTSPSTGPHAQPDCLLLAEEQHENP